MHVSIIDDEKILAAGIAKKLKSSGYATSVFCGYNDFMQNGDANSHLYIIDLSLGDGIGFDIIEWLRKSKGSTAPIIIISGYGDTQNITYALNIGADDYITKPLVPEELMARVKAVLRRPAAVIMDPVLRYKELSMHTESKEARLSGALLYLTKTESMVLELFLRNHGKVVSRERLITEVWGGCNLMDVSDNTINVTLSKIRKKLHGNFEIKTLYNQGYILE